MSHVPYPGCYCADCVEGGEDAVTKVVRCLLDEIGKSACADTILDSAAAGKAFAAIAEVEGRRG